MLSLLDFFPLILTSKAALARGMSPVQVANFLGRDEHEVGEKAREFE
jgi:hypothetical protein